METPFTIEEFLRVFEDYNTSVFPVQLLFIAAGFAAIILVHKKGKSANRFITGFLALVWIWIGVVYHLYFFSSINKAAYAFGVLFIIQGLLFMIEVFRKRLDYSLENTPWQYIGYFFILFGLLIYPVISYFLQGSFMKTISLGLPCPTTILSFGFLMLTGSKFPKYLLIIPSIWAIIGTGAAINFGVYQDYLMPVSAIMANIYLIKRKRYK